MSRGAGIVNKKNGAEMAQGHFGDSGREMR
jgi:hypothetical protein